MLPFGLLLAGAAPAVAAPAQTESGLVPSAEHPNIILFMVDDMGWQETSVPFYSSPTALNRRYRTPNMERAWRPRALSSCRPMPVLFLLLRAAA